MTNSSYDRQKPFQPITDRSSVYKPRDGWVGGSIKFPDCSTWTGGKADTTVEIVGSPRRGFVSLKMREAWVTETGRHMERVISVDINPENVIALRAVLNAVLAEHDKPRPLHELLKEDEA